MSRKGWKKNLLSLVGWILPTAALTFNLGPNPQAANAEDGSGKKPTEPEPIAFVNPLFAEGAILYAKHSSHSSHSSHASHASHASHFSGSGGSIPAPAPVLPAIAPATPAPAETGSPVPTNTPTAEPTRSPTPAPRPTAEPTAVPTSPPATSVPVITPTPRQPVLTPLTQVTIVQSPAPQAQLSGSGCSLVPAPPPSTINSTIAAVAIEFGGAGFALKEVVVVAGTPVVFVNKDGVAHRISISGIVLEIPSGATSSAVTFTNTGDYQFTDMADPARSGKVVVVVEPIGNSVLADAGSGAVRRKYVHARGDELRQMVTRAQLALIVEGVYGGSVSGTLDEITRAALRKYQEAKGLGTTGTLDRETLQRMRIMPRAQFEA